MFHAERENPGQKVANHGKGGGDDYTSGASLVWNV